MVDLKNMVYMTPEYHSYRLQAEMRLLPVQRPPYLVFHHSGDTEMRDNEDDLLLTY